MALGGGRFGDGAGAGTTAATLASVIGNRKQFKMLQFTVPAANAGDVTISTTAAGGATAFRFFVNSAHSTWQVQTTVENAPAGGTFTVDPTAIWLLGTDVNDVCYVTYLT